MKTFEEILDEVAKENGHEDIGWVFTRPYRNSHEMVKQAAKRYAKSAIHEDRLQLITEIRSYVEPSTVRADVIDIIRYTEIILP